MISLFEPEQFYGNLEYKLYIGSKKNDRILSQFFFRLREGNGKAIYIIGITDNGFLHITNIKLIIESIHNFIHIVGKYSTFKIRIFTHKPYVYAILCLENNKISEINDIIDFNLIH